MVPFPPRMLVCPSCSTPNHEAAAYCLRCGASLPRPGVSGTLPGDPALPPAPRSLTPGDVVDNKYRIERLLGEGGMGVVYLALDQNTSTHVVVKAIRGELAHDADLRDRVMAEGRALAQIDHPNVVRLNAIVIERGVELYLIMQYIEGQSLDRLIEQHAQAQRPLPFGQALHIFRQVVAGVGAAHREGVVHRDIKPGNVLLRAKDGVAKVTDFGIAKMEDDAKAGKGKTRGIIGSLWYMAPEQVTGRRDLDKRVDLYALGILFYEMLLGRVPFDAPSDYELMKMHVEAPLPSACAARPELPYWVDTLLQRACAKDRQQRFGSCDELMAMLDQVAPEPRGTGLLSVVNPAPAATTIPQGPLSMPRPAAAPEGGPPSMPLGPASLQVPQESLRVPRATTEDAQSSAITTHTEPTPAPARWPWAVGGLVAVGAAGVWVVGFSGWFAEPSKPPARPASSASARPATSAAPSASAPPPSRLDALQGSWRSDTGRRYRAVKVADFVEFRVVNPSDFPGQDYQADEPRFSLFEVAGAAWFGVEDKIRPQGPAGTRFDPRARGTCQAVWKSLKNEPLKAYQDGNRIRVDMVNITPADRHFSQNPQRTVVLGCNGLDTAPASRIEATLTRE